MDEILWCYCTNETSSAVLSHSSFIQYVDLNFESVDEILWCYHTNETSSIVLLHGTTLSKEFIKRKLEYFRIKG